MASMYVNRLLNGIRLNHGRPCAPSLRPSSVPFFATTQYVFVVFADAPESTQFVPLVVVIHVAVSNVPPLPRQTSYEAAPSTRVHDTASAHPFVVEASRTVTTGAASPRSATA